MNRFRIRSLTTNCGVIFLVAACSLAPFRHEPFDSFGVEQRAVLQETGEFTVRASVPGQDEAEGIFGVPLYDAGIQPVWLEIANDSDARARVVLSSIDPQYFSPLEVAYLHKNRFSAEGLSELERYLHDSALPRQIAAHQTVSGFVFTHASSGTKAFNLDIFRTTGTADYEQFTFFVEVPGFVPDHSEIEFEKLYAANEISRTDLPGLRHLIEQMPCCTTNREGVVQGGPIQVFFVAPGRDLLQALLRAGWSESSYERDEDYLAAADYLFGRAPDAIFRKGRDKTTERIELALWLAPAITDGEPVWVGQLKHAIGRRYAIGEMFFGVRLDPDVNDARNFILQNLWYTQSLEHWAWSKSGNRVPQDMPQTDFHGNPWFTKDPYRLVLWVSGEPMALSEASLIEWDRVDRNGLARP